MSFTYDSTAAVFVAIKSWPSKSLVRILSALAAIANCIIFKASSGVPSPNCIISHAILASRLIIKHKDHLWWPSKIYVLPPILAHRIGVFLPGAGINTGDENADLIAPYLSSQRSSKLFPKPISAWVGYISVHATFVVLNGTCSSLRSPSSVPPCSTRRKSPSDDSFCNRLTVCDKLPAAAAAISSPGDSFINFFSLIIISPSITFYINMLYGLFPEDLNTY